MAIKITLIPGDGIGPEVINSAVKCIEATGLDVEWVKVVAGEVALNVFNNPLPADVIDAIKETKVALKGPLTTPIGKGFRSLNVALRRKLDLFANIRPAKTFNGIDSRYDDVDLVIIRENLEGLYSGVEYKKGEFKGLSKDAAVSLKIITEKNTKRIAKFAFDFAVKNKRKKVTVVHKANIMKYTDGMFLRIANKVSRNYSTVAFDDRIIDNMAMQLVQKPQDYDMLLCSNFYGDVLSDLCAGLVGGLGIAPSANIGSRYSIFEPVHGSAPKYKGKDRINPIAAVLSGALLLRHIGKKKQAIKVENAVKRIIMQGRYVTRDINKKSYVGTKEMTNALVKLIKKG